MTATIVKSLSLAAIALSLVSSDAHALFQDDQPAKPRLMCFNPLVADAGYQVYLTDVAPHVTRLQVYEVTIAGTHLIASRNSTQAVQAQATTYTAPDTLLTISLGAPDNQDVKSAHLQMTLQNGNKISEDLSCTPLMHILSSSGLQ